MSEEIGWIERRGYGRIVGCFGMGWLSLYQSREMMARLCNEALKHINSIFSPHIYSTFLHRQLHAHFVQYNDIHSSVECVQSTNRRGHKTNKREKKAEEIVPCHHVVHACP